MDQRKKETQFVKMLRLMHLVTFDPILKPTYEHLVIKNIFHNSPVENQNDPELDFKVFFFADSCCSDLVLDESN